MPRKPRVVFPRVPHHVTQRGNRRGNVFFTPDDRRLYLYSLRHYCNLHSVGILSYTLMTNHVHLIVVPENGDGLHRVLKPVHARHAQWINRGLGFSGRLWQGRYFSSPLDDAHTWAAIRYVERNPVRAGMVQKAEDYQWSSAAAHCGLREDPVLSRDPLLLKRFWNGPANWSSWLAEGDDEEKVRALRSNLGQGLPCGNEGFIRRLERRSGRDLHFRPRGRKRGEKRATSPFKKGTVPF